MNQPSQSSVLREQPEEPTIDWLIDEICPNPGNSPLVNFNKHRIKALIEAHTQEAVRRGKIETAQELANTMGAMGYKGAQIFCKAKVDELENE